jgi:hypothetical protein
MLRAARGQLDFICSALRAEHTKKNAPRCARKPNYFCSALRAVFFCPALRVNNLKQNMQNNTLRCAQKT